MYRYVQITVALCIAAFGLATQASAQATEDAPLALEVTGGASFGNTTSGTFGFEADYRAMTHVALFAELGWIGNVVPAHISDRADLIAGQIGGTADPQGNGTYFNVGAKYVLKPFAGGYEPYVGLGLGVTHIATSTVFSVNGTELSEDQLLSQYGVQLGEDLAGTSNKTSILVLGGVTRGFGSRYALDLSYRYGRVFATDAIEDDQAINLQRLQVGFAIRF